MYALKHIPCKQKILWIYGLDLATLWLMDITVDFVSVQTSRIVWQMLMDTAYSIWTHCSALGWLKDAFAWTSQHPEVVKQEFMQCTMFELTENPQ